ncbi:hypothetical protein FNV43_RR22213 [Rhamnella rubrinervis]|uniref:FAD-dependent oxidoreductase domain-containing protein 1 n=1 Tax=Rhamnella rubrinervis TaxID=2594499 RepID=A0A8K0DR47_9ROSA|nr:hypothetical protein FNV43_RR22213 [Rhamnella rubrinervis]
MALDSAFCSLPNVHNDAVPSFRNRSCSFAYQSSLLGSKFNGRSLPLSIRKTPSSRPGPFVQSGSNPVCASHHTFDVVVIGAGIIGLSIARQLLLGSDLSVAVVDKAVPCSGATGAGSLLIGRNPEEVDALKRRVTLLHDAGLRAEYLSGSDLLLEEPDLLVDKDTGAAFLPDDYQLDAQRAVAYIQKVNKNFTSEGRYAEIFHDPVTSLLRSDSSGEVVAVKTFKNTLYSKKAIVVAAGCWSGSLMHDLLRESEVVLDIPVKPRKGHLLVLENFDSLYVNHGLMEAGYVNHQTATLLPRISTSEVFDHGKSLSVSMTATMDFMGNLLLGSSREFSGFSTEVEESIVNSIWNRAMEFFPKLRERPLSDFIKSRRVRTGLRPYMPDGKPVIGPVPGLPNVFLATGHEGGGLSMALGTAEMVVDMVLGNPEKVDTASFAVQGRC